MAQVTKLDSNVTGLRYAEETSFGVLAGGETWPALEPNSYSDFGGQTTTVARNPINSSRQRKKGVVTDVEAAGGFNTDLTQENLQDMLQGFFFASLRTKDELVAPVVDGINDDYEPVSGGDGYLVDDLLFAKGFDDAANNGLKTVVTPLAASVTVAESLITAAAQTGVISHVGHSFAAGDLEINVAGTLPILKTTVFDLTTLGLIVGEWVYIGGDAALNKFATATNQCFARIRSIATNAIELDKAENTLLVDAGAAKEIFLFFGRVLKNESALASQVRRTYNIERQLGAPDDSQPAQIQAEYLEGAVPGEMTLNIPAADKINMDLSFMAARDSHIDGPTALKTGTRPAIVEADAFNTSSDFTRIKMSVVSSTDENPSALLAYFLEMTLTLNNNLTFNKAVGTVGAFEITAGAFQIGGSMTAYFANTNAVAAIRANQDFTLDIHMVKANTGISVDLPLITLGDARLNVEQDQAITLPLTMEAATGAKVDTALDHTAMMIFWDYLPDAAAV